jgi:molybdate transport system ATP-binding protein
MLRAQIWSHEPAQGLSVLSLGDGPEQRLWVGQHAAAVGQTVRARVLARDVSVSLSRATDTSILNVLPATIEGMQDSGAHSLMLLLRVAPEACLQARLTRRSCEQLGLRVGMKVFAQVKGAALL